MSQKYEINELKSYNHNYYRHNNYQPVGIYLKQKQNRKYQNNQKIQFDIKHQQTSQLDNKQFNQIYDHYNIDVLQQNVPQHQIEKNHKQDFIFNNTLQTQHQEIEKQLNEEKNLKNDIAHSKNYRKDSQSSTDSFENKMGRRKSQIDWLSENQILKQNFLKLDHVIMHNIFSPDQLIQFNDNQVLYEIECEIQKYNLSNCKQIKIKHTTQKNVKQIKLLVVEVLVQCSKCQQIIQVEAYRIKQTQSPAILLQHCGKQIRIDFLYNNNQNEKTWENQIVHISYLTGCLEKIVLFRAECAVICSCNYENDSILILEKPLQLQDGNYTLLANETYRKLCRYCCKEVILQECELIIMP